MKKKAPFSSNSEQFIVVTYLNIVKMQPLGIT